MVHEHAADYPSQWAAIQPIATRPGCTSETDAADLGAARQAGPASAASRGPRGRALHRRAPDLRSTASADSEASGHRRHRMARSWPSNARPAASVTRRYFTMAIYLPRRWL